jgi:hypothetical protein
MSDPKFEHSNVLFARCKKFGGLLSLSPRCREQLRSDMDLGNAALLIQPQWFRVPCKDWPGCPRGDCCTFLHRPQDNRPGVEFQRARDHKQQASHARFSTVSTKEVKHVQAQECRGHVSERPEPPAVDTEASEALLKWLVDRMLATQQVIYCNCQVMGSLFDDSPHYCTLCKAICSTTWHSRLDCML